LAGHSVSSIAFQKNYLEKLMPCQNCDKKNLVVFVQDKVRLNGANPFSSVAQQGIFPKMKSSVVSKSLQAGKLPG
jgi:hypothetical protein